MGFSANGVAKSRRGVVGCRVCLSVCGPLSVTLAVYHDLKAVSHSGSSGSLT